ncbi:hypothetical protein [Paludibaculum fermentans]|uniref:Uncharacterized protein n=1 Tax=Paludibaculum fermentans TaxID=1473598 RepID=A0A7S7NRT5_PALFE|nr:hypothetical protein [Paludibaculum fermentans]QOY88652.1 hypothetical protein IRI77_01435 [Paludibaculum fermentans]
MIQIQSNQLGGLEWKQLSAFARAYELRSGDSVLASVEFKKVFGTLAEAKTAHEAWTFKRTGFLTPMVTARVAGSEQDVAHYKPGMMGTKGEIFLPGGEVLHMKSTSFWGSQWALMLGDGTALIKFQNQGMLKHGAHVDIEPAARERPDLPLLLTLCWYILALHQQDSAATTAVIAAG